LEAVVVGVSHILINRIGTDRIGVRGPSSVHNRSIGPRIHKVLAERTASESSRHHVLRLAKAEAQRRVSGAYAVNGQQMAAEGAGVTDAQQHVRAELSLDRQVRRHRVRGLVAAKHASCTADWGVARPIYVGIGIRRRHTVGRNVYRKLLDKVRACQRANKWCRHHRRFWTGVGESVRWIAGRIGDGQTFDSREEATCSCTDAGFSGSARQSAQESTGKVRRVSNAQPWREIIQGRKSNSLGNAGTIRQRITRHQIAERCVWECLRFNALHERCDLVVLLGPRGDVVPAKAVVDRDIGPNAPAILRERTAVGGAFIKGRRGLLGVKVGKSQQEIGEAVAGGLICRSQKRRTFHRQPNQDSA
jgi:hypothetical protein